MKQPKVPKQSWREEAFTRLLRFARNDEEGCHCEPKLRAERGERFPSSHILRKITKPLGFEDNELFMLAGYISNRYYTEDESEASSYHHKGLDPYVASTLAQERLAVQRAVIGILSMLRSLAKSTRQE